MRKVIFTFVLLALVAPFAAADTAPEAAPEPAVEAAPPLAAAEAPAAEGEISLEEILAEVDPTADAEAKYLCMPGSCTTAWDCEMNQDPYACNDYMCDNPTGQACRGTCFCC